MPHKLKAVGAASSEGKYTKNRLSGCLFKVNSPKGNASRPSTYKKTAQPQAKDKQIKTHLLFYPGD